MSINFPFNRNSTGHRDWELVGLLYPKISEQPSLLWPIYLKKMAGHERAASSLSAKHPVVAKRIF